MKPTPNASAASGKFRASSASNFHSAKTFRPKGEAQDLRATRKAQGDQSKKRTNSDLPDDYIAQKGSSGKKHSFIGSPERGDVDGPEATDENVFNRLTSPKTARASMVKRAPPVPI